MFISNQFKLDNYRIILAHILLHRNFLLNKWKNVDVSSDTNFDPQVIRVQYACTEFDHLASKDIIRYDGVLGCVNESWLHGRVGEDSVDNYRTEASIHANFDTKVKRGRRGAWNLDI